MLHSACILRNGDTGNIFNMIKYFIFTLCLIGSLFIACRKDTPMPNALIGEWELSASVDGMTGKTSKSSSGKGNVLKIFKESYERYEHWELVESGSYSIVQENSILYNKRLNRIIFNEEFDSPRTFITIDNNQLTVWLDAYDAPSVIYKKLK